MRCKAVITVSAFLAAISVQSCDLFQTRDPEPPSQSNSTFDPPVSPDIVLHNLQFALTEYNIDNYIRCFVDPTVQRYEYIASQEVQANFSNLFAQWNLEAERRYFQNLGPPTNASPFLTFSNQQTISVSSDSVIYNMNYTLFFPHRRSNIPQAVQGNMQVSLGTDNQRRWSIHRWQDFKTMSDSTWSYLKAAFSGS